MLPPGNDGQYARSPPYLCWLHTSYVRTRHMFFSGGFVSSLLLVGGFTLNEFLDKPWSQVSTLLPPGSCLYFVSRIGYIGKNTLLTRYQVPGMILLLLYCDYVYVDRAIEMQIPQGLASRELLSELCMVSKYLLQNLVYQPDPRSERRPYNPAWIRDV